MFALLINRKTRAFDYSNLKTVLGVFRAAAFILFFVSAAGHTESLKLMPGATATWLAKDMNLNGIPASIQSLRFRDPIDDVVAYYRARFRQSGQVIERPRGEWTVLATRIDKRFVSLQLKADAGATVGIATFTDLPDEDATRYRGALPIPQGVDVLSHQRHNDDGRNAETVTLGAGLSVANLSATIAHAFESEGWVQSLNQPAQTFSDGHVLRFSGPPGVVDITVGYDKKWSDQSLALLVLRPLPKQ